MALLGQELDSPQAHGGIPFVSHRSTIAEIRCARVSGSGTQT